MIALAPLARFVEVVHRPDAAIPLDEAAFLIAAQAHPGLDIAVQLERLDAIATSCRVPTLDGLRDHLFAELGFGGNRDDYYDPRNSLLDDVLDRRIGIPITLSVVMMEVGRRVGVPLSGVGLPGHFLVRDKVDPSVFVDPFDRGRVLDAAGCERRFREVRGPGVAFDPSFLEPVERAAIVGRMLTNLEVAFTANRDADALAWVLALAAVGPAAEANDARKLARILAKAGAYRAAADELERIAAVVWEPAAEQLHRTAGQLRARLN